MLWLIALPLLGSASVMVIRRSEGKSMFTPGRDHLHHHLLDTGLAVRKSVLVLCGLAVTFGGIGLGGERSGVAEGVLFLGFMATLTGYVAIMTKVQRAKTQRALAVAAGVTPAASAEPVAEDVQSRAAEHGHGRHHPQAEVSASRLTSTSGDSGKWGDYHGVKSKEPIYATQNKRASPHGNPALKTKNTTFNRIYVAHSRRT